MFILLAHGIPHTRGDIFLQRKGDFMRLKVWVVKERVNRLDFSKALGVAPTTFSGYCSGDRMPSPGVIVKMHNLSGGQVSFADFYNDRP